MTSEIIDVTKVQVLHDRVVRLEFDTGETGVVDLAPLLWGPAFEALADDALFRQVHVDPAAGTIVWPNGADISPHTLHQLATSTTTAAS